MPRCFPLQTEHGFFRLQFVAICDPVHLQHLPRPTGIERVLETHGVDKVLGAPGEEAELAEEGALRFQ